MRCEPAFAENIADVADAPNIVICPGASQFDAPFGRHELHVGDEFSRSLILMRRYLRITIASLGNRPTRPGIIQGAQDSGIETRMARKFVGKASVDHQDGTVPYLDVGGKQFARCSTGKI